MISFDAVSKRYPARGAARSADVTRPAVDDVSLQIPRGQITVLAGSSGSGKTTLLRMVNRMVEPSSGRVLVDGDDVAGLNPVSLRRRIGYVMQNAGLLPHHTVAQNITVVPQLTGADRAEQRSIVAEMMELVELDPSLSSRYPSELSGGQAQRVGVARGLAGRPEILLMDEPFGAVDPLVRSGLQAQLRSLQRRLGTTVVFVTHDMDEALRLGDHIVLLGAAAQIEQQGTGEEFVTRPANDFVRGFLGLQGGGRELFTRTGADGSVVVVDAHGRPAGVLAAEPETS
ncbi:MAG: ABC transporter ATP-binding protein [Micrococcaceae bacterium]